MVLLAGCRGSTPSGSPVPAVSVATTTPAPAPISTSAPATTTALATTTAAKPDTAQLGQMLKNLDAQLAAGSKALDDATAAIKGGEGDVTP